MSSGMSASKGCLAIFGGFVLVLFLISSVHSCSEAMSPPVASAPPPPPVSPEDAARIAAQRQEALERARQLKEEAARRWEYLSSSDPMVDGVVRSAYLHSVNEFEFDFPYEGLQRGALLLRQHPRHGADVMVMIQRGQIACRIGGCSMQVRFGDAPATAWAMVRPEGGSSHMLFVEQSRRFVDRMAAVDQVLIELVMFQEAPVTLVFDVRDFDRQKWLGGAPNARSEGSPGS